MKHIKFLAGLLVLALVLGTVGVRPVSAASKKTIVVTTQEELVAALKQCKKSDKKVTIKIKTEEKVTFTISNKYSADNLRIEVDAPSATIKNKAELSSVIINEAANYKEYAKGNSITVNDTKLTLTTMAQAAVDHLTIASDSGKIKFVNNGSAKKISVTGDTNIKLTQNGDVGHMYIGSSATCRVIGASSDTMKITVTKNSSGASINSMLPLKVNAYAPTDLVLSGEAENSRVIQKSADADIKIDNSTGGSVSVKNTDGTTQTVDDGKELTVEAKDKTTEMPVPDQSETRQAEPEQAKPAETDAERPSTGGGSDMNGGGSSRPSESNTTEPVNEPVAEPVTEPVTEPVDEPVSDPVIPDLEPVIPDEPITPVEPTEPSVPPAVVTPVIYGEEKEITFTPDDDFRLYIEYDAPAAGINVEYQWYRNGDAISGANDYDYIIPAAYRHFDSLAEDTYHCTVTFSHEGWDNTTSANSAVKYVTFMDSRLALVVHYKAEYMNSGVASGSAISAVTGAAINNVGETISYSTDLQTVEVASMGGLWDWARNPHDLFGVAVGAGIWTPDIEAYIDDEDEADIIHGLAQFGGYIVDYARVLTRAQIKAMNEWLDYPALTPEQLAEKCYFIELYLVEDEDD